MKKTHRANISGYIFNIDEDAYSRLTDYLDSIKRLFSDEAESTEILSDVEARIAELFQQKLTDGKQVITIDDVLAIIEIMGSPSDYVDGETIENPTAGATTERGAKRMYRDGEKRLVGGVCSGLGHYFRLDPLIFRIIFVLLAFTLTGILLYVLMWLVVPEAKTTTQKLEMKGEAVNLSNIRKSAQDEVLRLNESMRRFRQSEQWKNISEHLLKIWGRISKILLTLLRIIGIPIGAIAIIGGLFVTVITFGTLFASDSFISPTSWPHNHSFDAHTFLRLITSDFTANMVSMFAFVTVLAPMVLLVFFGVKLIFRFKSKNKMIVIGALMVFLVCGIITGLLAANIGFQFKNNESKEIGSNLPSGINHFVITSDDNTLHSKDSRYISHELAYIPASKKIRVRPQVQIEYSSSGKNRVRIQYKACGKNYEEARAEVERMQYEYQITDSIIYLPSTFETGPAMFRDQEVEIIIELAEGKTIYIDPTMKSIINWWVKNDADMSGQTMTGEVWRMTADGLSRQINTGTEVTIEGYESETMAPAMLTDNKTASANTDDKNWFVTANTDLEAAIDLKRTIQLNEVTARFLNDSANCVSTPQYVELYTSTDGITYSVSERLIRMKPQTNAPAIDLYRFALNNKTVRYIKLVAKNNSVCKESKLMIDEIEIKENENISDDELQEMKQEVKR